MANSLQTTFSNVFFWLKFCISIKFSLKYFPKGFNWQYVNDQVIALCHQEISHYLKQFDSVSSYHWTLPGNNESIMTLEVIVKMPKTSSSKSNMSRNNTELMDQPDLHFLLKFWNFLAKGLLTFLLVIKLFASCVLLYVSVHFFSNIVWRPVHCFTNVSQALQNNITKINNARNHIYGENSTLKLCACAFGHMYKVTAWNSHKKYNFGNTQISRENVGELAKL